MLVVDIMDFTKGKRILLIEDREADIINITDRLEFYGCDIATATTVQAGLDLIQGGHFDLIILDLQLEEDNDGYDVLRKMKKYLADGDIPVIVYSNSAGEKETYVKILGLGAMWCIDKNRGIIELESTLIRALEHVARQQKRFLDPQQMLVYFDKESGSILIEGRKMNIKLTALESKLLAFLFDHRGKICTYDDIVDGVYGGRFQTNDAITAAAKRLREKLGDNAKNPRFIKTERGRGFKLLVNEVDPS